MNLVQMKKMMMAFAVISSPVVISEMISTNNVEASNKTGWIKSGTGAWYYYDAKGNMVKNKWIGNYYVGSTGVMETSKWIGNYYVDTTGKWVSTRKVESKKTGWQKEGTIWYYYNEKGNKEKNKWVGNYYLGSTGVMETSKWIGNYYVDENGKWNPAARKAEVVKKTGWQKEGTVWYYYDEKGNRVKNKWVGNYYVGSTGVMETSKWIGNYYVDENGKWDSAARKEEVVKKTGWQKEGTVWYYYDEKGNRVKNKWVGNYYVGSTGVMETSKWIGGYYVDETGKWVPNKVDVTTKENVTKQKYKLVDISEHNGTIDFSKLKNHVDGVIIRVGFGTVREDRRWREYVNGAINNGIPYGFYWYSYALNEEQARQESDMFLNTIKNYKPEYPVFIDMEDADYWKQKQGKHHIANTWAGREKIIKAHTSSYERSGYYAGVYASKSWFDNMSSDLNKYMRWVAHWTGDTNSYKNTSYGMHQYTSDGSVPGINGRVDMNIAWEDYPSIIKRGGFNKLK